MRDNLTAYLARIRSSGFWSTVDPEVRKTCDFMYPGGKDELKAAVAKGKKTRKRAKGNANASSSASASALAPAPAPIASFAYDNTRIKPLLPSNTLLKCLIAPMPGLYVMGSQVNIQWSEDFSDFSKMKQELARLDGDDEVEKWREDTGHMGDDEYEAFGGDGKNVEVDDGLLDIVSGADIGLMIKKRDYGYFD